MSTISNKFYVEAIDDGSTLHAQLLSDKSLSQGYTPTGCVPDWSVAANQPVVYVDVLNGDTRVSANSGGVWTYNNAVIDFEHDDRFELLSNYIPTGYTTPVPAIKITNNLASSQNVNTDTIGYSGSYTLGGSDINFAITTFVRITGIMANGVFGQIEFVDNSNVIDQKGQVKTMRARLYGADGEEIQATSGQQTIFTTSWYLNDVLIGTGGAITVDGTTYYQAKQVSEGDLTDNAIIKCVFSYTTTIDGSSSTLTYTAYESIDDQTDVEQMYIQTVVSGGGAGLDGGGMTLRKGQSVAFHIWMGQMTDGQYLTDWKDFYVRLQKSDGSIVMDNISGIPNVESTDPESEYYGYRKLTWDNANHYATLSLTFDLVKSIFNKYLTGYVKAYSTIANN